MSRYEERVYISRNVKKGVEDLRKQLAVLRSDLAQYAARSPGGPMVAALRDQIRRLEAEIADAEASRKRDRDAKAAAEDDGRSDAGGGGRTLRATSGRFPPRRRGS